MYILHMVCMYKDWYVLVPVDAAMCVWLGTSGHTEKHADVQERASQLVCRRAAASGQLETRDAR